MPRFAAPRPRLLLPLALGAALLGGCAELRTPNTALTPPLDLVPGSEDPVRGAVRLAARDFADQGAVLQGRPAATARAAARLEYLTQTLTLEQRFAALPPGLLLSMGGAVREVRQALGISETALPEQVVPVLAQAARALDAGRNPPLPEALFPAGPEATLRRLREPGPLPEAAIATGRLQEAVAALDAGNGWTVRPEGMTVR